MNNQRCLTFVNKNKQKEDRACKNKRALQDNNAKIVHTYII